MTPTQRDIVQQLIQQYGTPDTISTNDGGIFMRAGEIVRLTWWSQKRSLFILPNGNRLSWKGC